MGVSSEDDWTLIEKSRSGAHRAYGALVRRYEARALAYAGALLGDDVEAEDAVQDAFVRAYRSLGRLEEGSAFGPWLRAIVRNLCLDRLKSARRRRERPWSEDAAAVAGRPADAHRELEREELARRVQAAVRRLGREQREVLVLREMDGLGYAEIARVLGIAEGTVASRLHHARQALQRVLEDDGITSEWMER